MLISAHFKRMPSILAILLLAGAAHAISSTDPAVMPNIGAPQSYQAHVDVDPNNCITLRSSPYVIAGGAGGANMNLKCPAEHPVMYRWQYQVGLSNLPPLIWSVTAGWGYSWIQCCAIAHSWEPVAPSNMGINNNPR